MSEMPGTEQSAYPWLAEQGEMSPESAPSNGKEAASVDGEAAPVVADSTAPMNDSPREPAVPFLQSLVDAMRKIAEQTRDDALAQLRAAVAERSAGIHSETEKRAAELHEIADTDVRAVASWELGEVQRIRDEAAAKVSARNATLDAQIAANVAAGEGTVTAVQARVDAFEAEMSSFFAQLNDIHDPAALASALKRIPTTPSLADAAPAPAGDTAPSPAAVVAAEPAEPESEPEPVPATAGMPEPEVAMEAPSPVALGAAAGAAVTDKTNATGNGLPETMEAAEAAPVATAVAEPPGEPAVEAPAEEEGEEAVTQVLVTGLTSFGAITSFKQSLERIAGVHRVSLGLGTSGEFVFTAAHRAGFDLSAAIRSFEDTAQFVAANGQLRVTVGAKG